MSAATRPVLDSGSKDDSIHPPRECCIVGLAKMFMVFLCTLVVGFSLFKVEGFRVLGYGPGEKDLCRGFCMMAPIWIYSSPETLNTRLHFGYFPEALNPMP